jgi:hypothetical protein
MNRKTEVPNLVNSLRVVRKWITQGIVSTRRVEEALKL